MVRKRPLTTRVVVFGREPVRGRVKSRLASSVGDELAAAAYAVLLDHTLQVAAAGGFPTVLMLAEPPSRAWAGGLEVDWCVQRSGDLGTRMKHALDLHLGVDVDRVVIVGSDCPGLRARHLHAADRALDGFHVVLGPAADGGYWMVGQRRPSIDLFTGVPWSSPQTLAATRQRLHELGVLWTEVDMLYDIDTEADLRAALDDGTVAPSLRRRLRAVVSR